MVARLGLYTYTEKCTGITRTKWKNDWLLRIYYLTTANIAYPDKDELSRSVYKIFISIFMSVQCLESAVEVKEL